MSGEFPLLSVIRGLSTIVKQDFRQIDGRRGCQMLVMSGFEELLAVILPPAALAHGQAGSRHGLAHAAGGFIRQVQSDLRG